VAAPLPIRSDLFEDDSKSPITPITNPRRPRRWRWIAAILAALLIILAVGIRLVVWRAQPILRARVIETLSARFKSRVELAALHVSVADGLQVSGSGLQIFGATDPNPYQPGVQPLLLIQEFHFSTPLRDLFREPMRVATVYVTGMTLNIPPKEDRRQIKNMRQPSGKMSIAVGKFVCQDTKLLINTSKPGKAPLEFDIGSLTMLDIGPAQPLHFDARLVNPKPVGDIQSSGQFGPLQELSPRNTPVQGDYTFSNADLGTIKGIGGILSSTGKYDGTLGRIVVDGETDTPDFRLAVSGHPVPLHTDFHAIVDGTDGDTYLDPVKARVLQSTFTASGKIVRVQDPHGHDIELNVVLDRARIEDLLQLGVKTDPPVMTGAVEMKTKLSLPPGAADVANRLKLAGSFHIPQAHFTNQDLQGKIDSLSLRSHGKPKLAKEHLSENENVASELRGGFELSDGVLTMSSLHFQIPGTHADVTGQYSLDGNTFDFHGTLRLDAKLSQMTTGWKSILLKPVDPFFHKHGAGTEVPFKVTGTRSAPRFGLDFGRKEESKSENNVHSTTAH
jgi:hypothetical protein